MCIALSTRSLRRSRSSSTDVTARAVADEPKPRGIFVEPATLAANVAAAMHALARVEQLVKTVPEKADIPAEPNAGTAPAAKANETNVNDSLAQLAQSLRALSDTGREPQQRLDWKRPALLLPICVCACSSSSLSCCGLPLLSR